MQGTQTTRLNCYLDPRKGRDRTILAHLRADRARGTASSEVVRRALEAYYAPPAPPAASLLALTEQVGALTTQVQELRAALTTLSALATENAELRAQLAATEAHNARLALAAIAANPKLAREALDRSTT